MTSRLFPIVKYVRHEHIEDYMRVGWVTVADLGEIHGRWAVLMGWHCDCPVVLPL
jgi:hypothetical protein